MDKIKRPMFLHIDPEAVDRLKNPDCLSLTGTIFRNGGQISYKGEIVDAIPFIELTPGLLKVLKQIVEE